MVQSLWTISALSDFGAKRLSLFYFRGGSLGLLRSGAFCGRRFTHRDEIAQFAQSALEGALLGGGNHEIAFSGRQAVLASPRVVGDKYGQRGVVAFNKPGQAAVTDLAAAVADILDEAENR